MINLGTGKGVTVRQLADAFGAVTGTPLRTEDAPPRPGDVVGAYTRCDRSAALPDWRAKYELEDGIRHALEWRRRLLELTAAEAVQGGSDTLLSPSGADCRARKAAVFARFWQAVEQKRLVPLREAST